MSSANRMYDPRLNAGKLARFMDQAAPDRVAGHMAGTIRTRRPSKPTFQHAPRRSLQLRKWQSTPDREASMKRRRMLGGSSNMPPDMRAEYTEGERAALAIVGEEVRKHGHCDLPIDRIAAVAGVSRTTVQNAVRKADGRHIERTMRPRRGQKSLTNVIRIIAGTWLSWLRKGARVVREIGFKLFRPSKNTEKTRGSEARGEARKGRGKRVLWQRSAQAQGQRGSGGLAQ